MKALGTLALLALGTTIPAHQPDHALGPLVSVHYLHASGATIDNSIPFQSLPISTSSSSGGGVTIGYGFLPWLSGYVTLEDGGGQALTSTVIAMNGSLTLYQVDAGARFQWPLRTVPLTPYVLLAYSSRLLSGPVTSASYGNGTFSEWGSAVTYGAGLEYFLTNAFASDLSYDQSSGTYNRLQLQDGFPFDTHAPSTVTSRVLAGVTWQPGPVTPAGGAQFHVTGPLNLGQDVRVRAGTTVLMGRVVFLGRDTLILQGLVKDQPVQTAVPLACLSTVERQREPRPIEPDLTAGALIGAVGGGLVGVVLNSQSTHAANKPGKVALYYVLPGAFLGAAVGGLINEQASRWEPVPLPPPAMGVAERESLCRSWSPLG